MRGATHYIPILLLLLAYLTAAVLFVLSSELFRMWWRKRENKMLIGLSLFTVFAGILSLALPFRYTFGWTLVLVFLLSGSYGLYRFAQNHAKAVRIALTLLVAVGSAITISTSLGIFNEPRSAAALLRTLEAGTDSLSQTKKELGEKAEKLAQEDQITGVLQSSDPSTLIPALQQIMVQREVSTLAVADTTSRVFARGNSGVRNDYLIQTEPWIANSINGDTVTGLARTTDGKVSIVASTSIRKDDKNIGLLSISVELKSGQLEELRKNEQSFAVFSSTGFVDEGGATQAERLLLSSRALEDELQSYLASYPKTGSTKELQLLEENGTSYRLLVRTVDTLTTETIGLVIMQPITPPTVSPTLVVLYSIISWTLLALLIWLIITYKENLKKEARHA